MSLREVPGRLWAVTRALRAGPLRQARDLMSPYDTLLRRRLSSDLTRGPVSAFAAHAGVSPTEPGGALFAYWQLAHHRYGQWHAKGGAQGLTDALITRARALGVEVRCSAAVTSIEHRHGKVTAVIVGDGTRIPTETVIAAINPRSRAPATTSTAAHRTGSLRPGRRTTRQRRAGPDPHRHRPPPAPP